MRNSRGNGHFYDVRTRKANFGAEVDKLMEAHQEDAAAALCRLSVAQQAFDTQAEGLKERLAEIPLQNGPEAGLPIELPPMEADEFLSLEMPKRMLQLFWLLLAAFSLCAFAAGYWVGRFS